MSRTFSDIPFERYVDDAVVHCHSRKQAEMVHDQIGRRLRDVGLKLHPDKTKLVYCQDGKRRGSYEQTCFTFLGYTFRARGARNKHGQMFTSFLPAISKDALTAINREVRSWRLHLHSTWTLGQITRWINPIVRGWIQYYGRYYRSALYVLCKRINTYLVRWARKKYKRLHGFKKVHDWWKQLGQTYPRLFFHWSFTEAFMPTGW